jgi:hypothetical protein
LPASSRLKPKVIWVRSLVPKEKNSASLAIGRRSRGAGHLDHGADKVLHGQAALGDRLSATVVDELLDEASSRRMPTSGIMISG